MTDTLDGRIGEALVGRCARTAATSTWSSPGADRRRPRPSSAHSPARGPGHTPFLVVLGSGTVVRPLDDLRQQDDDRFRGDLGRLTWGAAQLGIAQGVLDAVADGSLDPAEAAGRRPARRGLGRPEAHDESARSRRPTARRCEPRSPTRSSPPTAEAVRALVDRRDDVGERASTRVAEPAHRRASRSAATRSPLDPPFKAAWDPVPRARQRGEPRDRPRRRRARRATRAATTCPTRRCSRGCSPASTRAAPRWCASSARRSTSTAGGRGPSRSRSGTWSARALGEPLWRLLGGRSRAAARLRVERRARRAGRARAARAWRCATPACGRSSCASTTPTGARTSRSSRRVRDAVGRDVELMVDANQGWRMAGDRDAALGRGDRDAVRPRARAARRLLAGGAAARPPTSTGYARLRAGTSLRIAAGEMVRGLFEARDLLLRGGVDVIQPDVVLAGGLGGCRRIAALADLCGRVVLPAHVVERARPARQPAPRAGGLDLPVPRGAVRPAGVDARAARLAAGGAAGEIARRRHGRPPAGPGLGVTPDLDALEAHRIA